MSQAFAYAPDDLMPAHKMSELLREIHHAAGRLPYELRRIGEKEAAKNIAGAPVIALAIKVRDDYKKALDAAKAEHGERFTWGDAAVALQTIDVAHFANDEMLNYRDNVAITHVLHGAMHDLITGVRSGTIAKGAEPRL